MEESCCTCATLLSDSRRRYTPAPAHDSDGSGPLDEKQLSEKGGEVVPDRRLECCARVICGRCLDKNVRFATYCPYCQISTEGHDLSIPSAGLRNPPSYDDSAAAAGAEKKESQQQCRPLTPPPPYTAAAAPTVEKQQQPDEPPPKQNGDVLHHFLDHAHDTIPSLSLRYNIPAATLRAANRLGSDHLLLGRRVIVIPASSSSSSSSSPPSSSQTTSPSSNPNHPATATSTKTIPPLKSLSPHPVEGEAEERRKAKIRRWMVACREADYDVALLYLDQAAYDLDAAVDAYFADEAWERANPLPGGKPSPSSSSSSPSASAGRMGFGAAGPGEGGWMWAAQAPFLRRGRKKDQSDSTPQIDKPKKGRGSST